MTDPTKSLAAQNAERKRMLWEAMLHMGAAIRPASNTWTYWIKETTKAAHMLVEAHEAETKDKP